MATINYLTAIEFDFGASARLKDIAASVGIRRPMLVTDPGLSAGDVMARIRSVLPDAVVFDKTPQNPTEDAVMAAAALFRDSGCDGLVALGGGSPIDLAKGVALMATHDGALEPYAMIRGGLAKITAKIAPVIAVPTTAGTGSEVGRAALITLRDGSKLGFISPHMIPKVAVCDPELTLGLPPRLTAATGMDALTHCIETYLSPRVNPPADAIALDGASRAARWIRTAFIEGGNRDARWNMMMASLQGGLTFQKGLGAVHSMSHPLGGLKAPVLHHGTLNAVILPAVLRFNRSHAAEKIAALERAVGVIGTDLASWIERLNADLGLPPSLRAMGVTDDMIPRMVEGAMQDHSTATNPRSLARADFESLFKQAMH
ncbi:1,3-propanediol dehydrogenase [Usitatibacter rugosus]|uniref:1,3-propanediol dehydrogenase n=1 Tax=Usitatibacter rugosus TaxID=2732067 RepID=A0A6M4GZX0_9PROT|nr:iron-containing alcohol dehydrogenase [Usitatibacter rugosus]QJR12034.1 1,3-propanediol dehydrogenase [Usitatibacter rugosus]